ncbi:hypothetical protein C8046_16450 [Serinibacter arcticus]|uniref:Uncharacterized protein n=1 Tax=Serinibacter arcticus TaxID=1655435 RepID=A0A2U1ZYD3_9MICO|nr:hypothetical protein C8046_16450 [Serinibacter arcticus]
MERIIPVEYSPEIARAPSTATVIWPMKYPNVMAEAPKLPALPGSPAPPMSPARAETEAAKIAEMPTMPSTVRPRVHHVERSVVSLIHSERRRWRKVTRPTAAVAEGRRDAGAAVGVLSAVMPQLLPGRGCRRSGTRPRRP